MRHLFLMIFITLSNISSIAKADVTTQHVDKKGYSYTFDDDPLNAGGFGANDAIIKIRPKAARTTLIRPRTSFVQELLKSVESL